MKKISMIICMLLAISLSAGCASKGAVNNAETENASYEYIFRELPEPKYIEAAESFAGGSGTETDPYQISTAAELALMSELTNDADNSNSMKYNGAYYELTADIQLNDTSNSSDWSNTSPEYSWKPMSDKNSFTGSFDGNGYTIRGLYLNSDFSDRDAQNNEYGLFGTNQGSISNVKLTDSYICVSGYSSYIGSICGSNYGRIIGCESSANLEYYDANVGGIAGTASKNEKINENGGVIENCVFKGNIADKRNDSSSYAGGIVGTANDNSQIKNCQNYSDISLSYDNSNETAGIAAGCSKAVIEECTNYGNISSKNSSGGIAASTTALNDDQKTYIKNCVNEGTVCSSGDYAGGIVADGGSNLEISNCKNSGEISEKEGKGVYAAGIIANIGSLRKNTCKIESCENSGYVHSGTPSGIVAMATVTNETNISVKDCVNSGKISSTSLYSSGIFDYINITTDENVKINIESCTNSGAIEAKSMAGGIVAFSSNIGRKKDMNAESYLKINSCTNDGGIYVKSSGGVAGGIAASCGLQNFITEITDCTNAGTLNFADAAYDGESTGETDDSRDALQMTRIGGGIVGKIGDSIELAQIIGDDKNNANVNAENAVLKLSGCRSIGDFVYSGDKEYNPDNNSSEIVNAFGGIVGYSSSKDGYSFKAENCSYSSIEQGLGNNYGAEIGSKEK